MSIEAGHYYHQDGTPAHFQPCKTREGNRPTTIADARKLGLYPSVTTILKVLNAPALTKWLINNAVQAALTTPRQDGEELDAFVARIMAQDAEEEAKKARDRGTLIHDCLDLYMGGQAIRVAADLLPWLEPAAKHVQTLGAVAATEIVLVGEGYAGKADIILDCGDSELILDYKTSGTLPTKASWPEHQIQLAAYAEARFENKPVRTGNLYISTKECGRFAYFENPDWQHVYQDAFEPCFRLWKFLNNYNPTEPKTEP